MKPINEFQEIGKKLPYQVRGEFFDGLADKTLQKAKTRERDHKKMKFLWRPLIAAASLAALFFLGYLIYEPRNPESPHVVQDIYAQKEKMIEKNSENLIAPDKELIKKEAAMKPAPEILSTENMNNILADLSDEELMQLAAMYKSDPFIEEVIQQ